MSLLITNTLDTLLSNQNGPEAAPGRRHWGGTLGAQIISSGAPTFFGYRIPANGN